MGIFNRFNEGCEGCKWAGAYMCINTKIECDNYDLYVTKEDAKKERNEKMKTGSCNGNCLSCKEYHTCKGSTTK